MASSTLCKYTTHVCTLSCTCKSNVILRQVGPYISYTVKGETKLEPVASKNVATKHAMCYKVFWSDRTDVCRCVPPHQHHQLYVVLFVHVHIQNSGCV